MTTSLRYARAYAGVRATLNLVPLVVTARPCVRGCAVVRETVKRVTNGVTVCTRMCGAGTAGQSAQTGYAHAYACVRVSGFLNCYALRVRGCAANVWPVPSYLHGSSVRTRVCGHDRVLDAAFD